MTKQDEKDIISGLGINQIFEGIGNIINVVGKIVEEDEKTPVRSHNSQ